MFNRNKPSLAERVEAHYHQHKNALSSFLEINLDGFTFEKYSPLTTDSNNYWVLAIKHILEWDLRRRSNTIANVNPINRTVSIHAKKIEVPKYIVREGELASILFKEAELLYTVVHELCHMFVYANDTNKYFPLSESQEPKKFEKTWPIMEGVAHALSFEYVESLSSDVPLSQAFVKYAQGVYLASRRDTIMLSGYKDEFLRADKAYSGGGLQGVRTLLQRVPRRLSIQ